MNNKDIKNEVEIFEDYNHIVNVLRLKENDEITIFNNTNTDYISKIKKINKKSVLCEVIERKTSEIESSNVSVFQALLKGDKLDYLTQKLTEINAENLFLFSSERTISKWKEDKLNKLEKISIEACKQCGRSKALGINYVGNFNNLIDCLKNFDIVVFAYEKSENPIKEVLKQLKNKKVALIIGSEGGFSSFEAQKLCELNNLYCVSLGKTILRAETASLVLTSIAIYEKTIK